MPQQNIIDPPANMDGELRFPAALPEDAAYIVPPEGGVQQNGRWVYGEPNLNYGGQQMESGAPSFVVADERPAQEMEGEVAPLSQVGINGSPGGTGVSRDFGRSQRMKNPVDMAATHAPADSREAYLASMRSLLNRNVGYFVVCTFQMGNQPPVTWQGILHTVGSDYLVLYQPDHERYVSCDLYSLKFTQFHNVRGVPYCAASRNWEGSIRW